MHPAAPAGALLPAGDDATYGSDPWHLDNFQLNAWHGGRGVYFRDPNGHILELLTRV